ncbi:monovalent cation/proton antiporter, MnhG/PhaG subunit [Saccharicrinis carchari]|uniref:Monovalent cation/proton antiporter, MnhG/PhaG subunit n=1 Tax=Saccharicrinis carchari TaxID=1168039 RepID=A0A521AZB5_SACCC|nr:monovalent cation/H(+) antiporter subunit G [Saccharicrinis carchari]SMO40145.1 monovalent cation/proton antiporter, MnhG/PhaG subunit [Saccharicrinis carchari]
MVDIILVTLIFLGSAFILLAAIGLIRFNDLYSRLHATTKATSFGLLLLIIGVGLFFNTGTVWLKALMVIVFIYLTAPLAAHSIAKSDKTKDL